ncbi:unnamed protein product [Amoebophrya sp. A25]|nr:unnamed protein product [Amoebophrya sp. A25]|eukprot:GSA25T00018532001.1
MDPPGQHEHLFKLLIIGDSGVGKSCLMLRFTEDTFNEKQLATIGVDFKVKYVTENGKRIKLALWDTAGQERFRTLTSSYYRGAQGIIFVYDVSEPETFENVRQWLHEADSYNKNVVKMLVANKVDLPAHERKVSSRQGEDFALENSMMYIETSAKTKIGIQQAFTELVLKILDSPDLLEGTIPLGQRRPNNNVRLDQARGPGGQMGGGGNMGGCC